MKKSEPSPVFPGKTAKKEVLSYIPGLATSTQHSQDIRFPALRSVLWDRRAEGEIVTVGAEVLIPRLMFRRATLASLYQRLSSISDRHKTHWFVLSGLPISKLNVNRIGNWVGGLWEVGVSGCEEEGFERMKRGFRARGSGEICVVVGASPCEGDDGAPGFDAFGEEELDVSGLEFSEEEYLSILQRLRKTLSVRGPPDPFEAVLLAGKAEMSPRPEADMPMSIQLRLEAFVPGVSLSCTPLSSVPILSTPLARKVLEWSSHGSSVAGDDPTSSGFLTLNQTRKAVLLLEDDPLAYELPLVGIWLRGTAVGCQWKAWQSVVQDPAFVYTCLRYIHNDHIKERVHPQGAPPTTFLALLLSGTRGQPVFIECTLSLSTQDDEPLACAHYEGYVEVDVSPLEEKFNPHEETIACDFTTVENVQARQTFRSACEKVLPLESLVNEENLEAPEAHHGEYKEASSRFSNEAAEDLIEPTLGDFLDAHDAEAFASEMTSSEVSGNEIVEQGSTKRNVNAVSARSASKYSELIVAQQEKLDRLQEEMQRLCHLIDDKKSKKPEPKVQKAVLSRQIQNENATAVYLQGLNQLNFDEPEESLVGPVHQQGSIHSARKQFTDCLIPELEEEDSRSITPDPFPKSVSPQRNSVEGELAVISVTDNSSPSTEKDQEANTIISSFAGKMTAPEESEEDKGMRSVDETISLIIPRIRVNAAKEHKWDTEDEADDDEDDSLAKIEQKYLRLAKLR